jgi:hypothetical protein
MEEAMPAVLENYLGPSDYTNAAERMVEGERLMQASSDLLLGWLRCVGPGGHEADYYVRQMCDWKGSADVDAMTPQLLAEYGRWRTRLGPRSCTYGRRIAVASYLDRSGYRRVAFTRFAKAYADQNERDYAAFRAAAASN